MPRWAWGPWGRVRELSPVAAAGVVAGAVAAVFGTTMPTCTTASGDVIIREGGEEGSRVSAVVDAASQRGTIDVAIRVREGSDLLFAAPAFVVAVWPVDSTSAGAAACLDLLVGIVERLCLSLCFSL